MDQPVDSTPLLATSEDYGMKEAFSECKLQDKCFLSDGAAKSAEGYRKVQRKLIVACVLCFVFMIVEVIGGYIAKSVAIMSDAAHMLSDVSAFLVSIFATWAATQPSTWHYSFGYHRAEILGALVSVLTIWAVTGALVWEAVQRTINPVRVDGKLMFIVSMAGVGFNILIALTLGVHAHLGHSHGPDGGCSHGHSHDHDHDHDHAHNHEHDHSHGHSHAACSHSHEHQHSDGSKHPHSNGNQHSQGSQHSHSQKHGSCCGGDNGAHEHNHEHNSSQGENLKALARKCCASTKQSEQHGHQHHHESNGDHNHSHSDSDSSHHSHSDDEHGHAEPNHDHAGHSCSHKHQHSHTADTALTDSVVIDVPAAAAALASSSSTASCGVNGHATTCRCTISKVNSREIEVRCELPISAGLPAEVGEAGSSSKMAHEHSHSHGHNHDAGSINLRSAVLHVIGDLLQSIGVAIAGALIWYNQDDPRWYLADPICTFVFSIVVLMTTKSILRDIVHVLMERTPSNLNVPAMAQIMMEMDGIRDVHDLHVWNITTSMKPVLTAHVHIGPEADANVVLQQLEQYVRGLGIDHSTIQICNIQPQLEAEV